MTQRTILITGCSSGIGYDAALGLKARGWRVFASCRKPQDCARMTELDFESPLIDYQDADTIVSGLADVLEATGGQRDALFNNGAFACPGAVEDLPTGALRAIFEANFFGWHELTRHVIPVMRAQGHGRIVQNSSVLGFVTLPWRGAYVATKHALEGLSDTLRIEMKGTGVHASALCPGFTHTDFHSSAGLDEMKAGLPEFMWYDAETVVRDGIEAAEADKPIRVSGRLYRWLDPFAQSVLFRPIFKALAPGR